ncbi:hypothetical protein BC936DRAFT_141123 [Jimgerdemannia flammicorona]|uniref:Uncharacterized protein n=1 Tax=Jimgerdemannia flammicorona TaxID=994334 RepID=A0A433A2X4_9FUNG|nr:hypothetical protein BC936DRAFT_141123 [Jimgerdemannia flammicorona]
MHLLPKCLEALAFPGFWKDVPVPSLKKFLDFRFSEGDLKDEATEHYLYGGELKTLRNGDENSPMEKGSWQPEYTDYPAGYVLAVGTGTSLSVRTCSTDSMTQVLVRGLL